MSIPVQQEKQTPATMFSQLSSEERKEALKTCDELTDGIYPGMSVASELAGVYDQNIGDTVLLWKGPHLVGVAVCHCGAGSEGGPEACHVKFGAVATDTNSAENFSQLLDSCETLAARRGLAKITAGVNTARIEAYQMMLARGFKTEMQGVTMHRPNESGYSRPGAFVIDDWR
jgi:hypothetical protein